MERIEPVRRRRGPVAPAAITPVHEERREDRDPREDPRRGAPKRPRPQPAGGIVRDADGRPHVDVIA